MVETRARARQELEEETHRREKKWSQEYGQKRWMMAYLSSSGGGFHSQKEGRAGRFPLEDNVR